MSDQRLIEELKQNEAEPFLPIERTLVRVSLTVGLVLLVVLALINHFLPAA